MRAKLDESMPNEAADSIRKVGWECDTVHDERLGGAADLEIARACQTEGRVLFTIDLDFADIRAYPPADYIGIVVLRPVKPSRSAVLRLLERARGTHRAMGESAPLDRRTCPHSYAGIDAIGCLTRLHLTAAEWQRVRVESPSHGRRG